MDAKPLVPNDPRVEHKFFSAGEFTYYYMLAKPEGTPKATIVLIHGWPDLSLGWRYQVPHLTALGLQVIVPDMLGYGQTSAPDSHEHYTMKNMTSHISALIKSVTDQPVIIAGHDWGAFFAWRMAMYYPSLIRAIASFCVPYMPPWPEVMTTEKLTQVMPNFSYQAYLASGAVEAAVGTEPKMIAAFLNGNLGGVTPEGLPIFSPTEGIVTERLPYVQASPLASPEIMEFYVKRYEKHGLRGPCNWYRTHELNSRDELPRAGEFAPGVFQFGMPALIVMAENDPVLPPSLLEGQEIFFGEKGLKTEIVEGSSHWVMVHKPMEVNKHLGEFVRSVLEESGL